MAQNSGQQLIAEALEFFNLNNDFSHDDLEKRFHAMAKKYHPDRGEYSSAEIFFKIIEYRDILKSCLRQNQESAEDDYSIYKQAKKSENESILKYYKITEGNRIFLDANDNPALRELRKNLENSLELYEKLLQNFPESIWINDAKTSIAKIKVWMQ